MSKKLELVGKTFGKLTVIKEVASINGNSCWECLCECGKIKNILGIRLNNNKNKSCGCLEEEQKLDLMGQKFGRLLVINKTNIIKNDKICWECLCNCGNTKIVIGSKLKNGKTQSCGCLYQEIWAQNIKNNIKYTPKEASYQVKYNGYKRNAKKRNLIFDLTIEQFKYLTGLNCEYCNLEPQPFNRFFDGGNYSQDAKNNGKILFNGIDRKDNNLGYNIDNCYPCCTICNMAKGTMSYDQWIAFLSRIQNCPKKY